MGVQFVWFASDARRLQAQDVFSSIFGREADSFQVNRNPTVAAPHLSAASGVFDGLACQLLVQASRIDLVVQAHSEEDEGRPPLIGDTTGVVERISQQVGVVSDQLHEVNRLALVLNLIKPADSHRHANQLIAPKFDLSLRDFDVTDLSFQLNVRKKLASEITLNRLLKFGVASFQSLMIDATSQVISSGSVNNFGASLSVDVNTVPMFPPITPSAQHQLWQEIASEALSLRASGELKGLWQ